MNKSVTLGIFLLLLLPIVLAFNPITMEEGEWRTIEVGTQSYNIEVLIIEDTTPATVTFKINNQITEQLIQGASQQLQGAVLEVTEIILNEAGEAGSSDTIRITFTHYCGDHACEGSETCGSCNGDCGCSNGYFCSHDYECQEIECGDHICSEEEECEEDNCCWGQITLDFNSKYNCGECGKRCSYHEDCIGGICTKQPYCGDTICQEGEECVWDCPDQRRETNPEKEDEETNKILTSLHVYNEKNTTEDIVVTEIQKNVVEEKLTEQESGVFYRFLSWLTHIF